MRKFQTVFNTIAELRSLLRGKRTKQVKKSLGDSVNNNRTLTVSQVVRYLNKTRDSELAATLQAVVEVLENEILNSRSNRTDAIDINELVSTYRNVVMEQGRYRREIGSALSRVG